MGTQIAQITQIFMLAATLFQVPRKSPHIREIREIRERKKALGSHGHTDCPDHTDFHAASCSAWGVCIAVKGVLRGIKRSRAVGWWLCLKEVFYI